MQQEGGGAGQARGEEAEEELVFATWDCGSPLYDSFELASLYHVLERHLMILPFPGAASRRLDHHQGVAAVLDVTERSAARRSKARRMGWKGRKAAAAIYRSVTCWRRL